MIENNEITLEKILNEYNKYIMSRLIEKEYNFNALRKMVKQFSQDSEFIKYSEEMSDKEIAEEINQIIKSSNKSKIIKLD